jgi:hypothetical protein
MAWITKGSRGPLLVLPPFYNNIAMGAQASSISRQAFTNGEGSSKLSVLSSVPPLPFSKYDSMPVK